MTEKRKKQPEIPSIFYNYEKDGVFDYGWKPENDKEIEKIVADYEYNKDTSRFIKKEFKPLSKEDYTAVLTELMSHIEELNKLAWKDAATGLLNRHAFDKEMEAIVKPRIEAYKSGDVEQTDPEKYPPITVAKIDLNYLKAYNDFSYLHGGDVALKYLADFIKKDLRKNDQGQLVDTLVRFGGDELILIMRGCDEKTANARLQKISENIAYESLHGENQCIGKNKDGIKLPLQVSFAYGCAQFDISKFEKREDEQEEIIRTIKGITTAASDAEAKNKETSKKFAANIENGVPYSKDREASLKIVGKYLKFRIENPDKVYDPSHDLSYVDRVADKYDIPSQFANAYAPIENEKSYVKKVAERYSFPEQLSTAYAH